MAEVTFAADEAVYNLLDRDGIMDRFRQLNVSIIFSCVKTDDWADDSWIEKDTAAVMGVSIANLAPLLLFGRPKIS